MKLLKHHFVFLLMVLVNGFVWLQMIVYLLHELFAYSPKWGYLQYCVTALSNQTYLHHVVFFGLNIMMAYSFGKTLWIVCKQVILIRRWNYYIQANCHHRLSERMNRQYRYFGKRIIVVEQDTILALTSGFIRPKIILSTKLIELFSKQQLDAILWHEWSHCRNYDPAFLLLVKIMKDSMPFIPINRRLASYIQVWVELQADQYSVSRIKSSYDLASVLYEFARSENKVPIGVGFADKAINYRIQQLIEPHSKIHVPLLDSTPFMSSSFLVILLTGMIVSGCS